MAFSDVSDLAYASVLYLRSVYEDGSVEVRVVAAKAKITPVKKQSIELIGAFPLARLSNTVLPLLLYPKERYLWVDSMTVLYLIRNNKIVTQSGKTGLIAHLKVSRNAGFKYSECCSLPMVVATRTKFSHVLQQFITFQIIH